MHKSEDPINKAAHPSRNPTPEHNTSRPCRRRPLQDLAKLGRRLAAAADGRRERDRRTAERLSNARIPDARIVLGARNYARIDDRPLVFSEELFVKGDVVVARPRRNGGGSPPAGADIGRPAWRPAKAL